MTAKTTIKTKPLPEAFQSAMLREVQRRIRSAELALEQAINDTPTVPTEELDDRISDIAQDAGDELSEWFSEFVYAQLVNALGASAAKPEPQTWAVMRTNNESSHPVLVSLGSTRAVALAEAEVVEVEAIKAFWPEVEYCEFEIGQVRHALRWLIRNTGHSSVVVGDSLYEVASTVVRTV